MDKNLITVRRRFDWVTASGMVLFAFIVAAELCVAIGLPLLVRRQEILATGILRSRMFMMFDMMREKLFYMSTTGGDEDSKNELSLVSVNANIFADYLRTHAAKLNAEELNEIFDRIKRMQNILQMNMEGQISTKKIELDPSGYLLQLAGEAPAAQDDKKDPLTP